MKNNKIPKIINSIDLALEIVYLLAIFSIPLVFASDSFLAFYQQPKESLLHFAGFTCILLITIKFSLEFTFNKRSDFIELISNNKKVFWLLITILLFLISNFISSWLSIVPYASFWGRESGMAGNTLVSLISYLGIFCSIIIIVRENTQIKRILIVVLSSSSLVCLYGLAQHFFPETITWYTWMNRGRVYSTLGNPIYLGAFLIMTIPLSIVILNQLSEKITPRLSILISSLFIGLQLSVLVFTLSRGPWSGLLAGVICVIGYWIIFSRKFPTSYIRFITIIFSGFIIAILINYIPGKTQEEQRTDKIIERMGSISENLELSLDNKTGINVSGSGFSGRIEMWQGGLELIKKWPSPNGLELNLKNLRPLIGYGPDTYIYLYPQTIRPQREIVISSHPHNLILQILIELGLLGFITFSSIIIITFLIILELLKETKSSYSFQSLLIISVFTGLLSHLVEQMTGLGVTSDSLLFWVLISLVFVLAINKKPEYSNRQKITSLNQPNRFSYLFLLFNIPIFIILIFVFTEEINSIKASRNLMRGLEMINKEKAAEGLKLIEKARILKPFSETYTIESFKIIRKSAIASGIGMDEEEKTKMHLHSYSRLMDYEKLNPYSYNVEMFLARTSLDLFLRNPDFKIEVLNRYIYLTQLMPNYTDVFKVSANILLSIGAFDKALETTNKAIHLNKTSENEKPIPQAYWVRGEIFKIKEEYDHALIDLEKSILQVEDYIKEFTDQGVYGGVVFDEVTLNKKRAYQILATETIGEILSYHEPNSIVKSCLNISDTQKESKIRLLRARELADRFSMQNLLKTK